MKFKLAYFEDERVKIEVKNNDVYFWDKTSYLSKESIDDALLVFKYLCKALTEISIEYEMRCSEHCGNTVRDK